jgi:hypothetical protein
MSQLRGGAGGGRQVQRAGFLVDTALSSHDIGMRASVESGPPVIATPCTLPFEHRQNGASPRDSPLLEITSTRSSRVDHAQIAMAGLRRVHKHGRVPVDASVAAILRPIWPLLPMPITTTRPRTASIISDTACAKESPTRP